MPQTPALCLWGNLFIELPYGPVSSPAALMAHCSVADANPFLQSVHRCMTSRLLQLPDKHSVTALLNTWAQSIHQACLSAA